MVNLVDPVVYSPPGGDIHREKRGCMYKAIAIEESLFDKITALARATNRTNGGMVKEMFSQYVLNIPLVGKIEDGKIILRDDYAPDGYRTDKGA